MAGGAIGSYLKVICLLEEKNQKVGTVDIANSLEISPASVTEMLQKLASSDYISYSRYNGTKLTDKGKRAAKKILRKHRLLETFLKKILKLDDREVCRQASALEGSLSDQADQQLCIFLHRPMESSIEHKKIPHCVKKISCERCLKVNKI